MKNRLFLLSLTLLLSCIPTLGQRQTSSSVTAQQDKRPDGVLRVTTNLVQLDFVVTDKDG